MMQSDYAHMVACLRGGRDYQLHAVCAVLRTFVVLSLVLVHDGADGRVHADRFEPL